MLTYANFILKYPTSTLNQNTVEMWIKTYKRQLSKYFRFDDLERTEFFDIDYCGQAKVFLRKPLITTTPLVEELDIKTRVITEKKVVIDFRYLNDNFDNQEYYYALDFACLACVCKCDKLKITGVWGLLLPLEIEDKIYELIELKSLVVTTDSCQQIQSEKIGEYTVTYKDTANKAITSLDINNVYSIPLLAQIILQIQSNFIYV